MSPKAGTTATLVCFMYVPNSWNVWQICIFTHHTRIAQQHCTGMIKKSNTSTNHLVWLILPLQLTWQASSWIWHSTVPLIVLSSSSSYCIIDNRSTVVFPIPDFAWQRMTQLVPKVVVLGTVLSVRRCSITRSSLRSKSVLWATFNLHFRIHCAPTVRPGNRIDDLTIVQL